MSETALIYDGKLLSTSHYLALASSVVLHDSLANSSENFGHLGECPGTSGELVLHHVALPETQSLGETDQMQNTRKA